MNRIFKVIKSKRTGNDIAVSELASSKGGARRLSAALILASGLCAGSVMAEADNEGVRTDGVEISGNYINNGVIKVEGEYSPDPNNDGDSSLTGNAIKVSTEGVTITNTGVISGNINVDKSESEDSEGNSADEASISIEKSGNGIYSPEDVASNNSGIISGNTQLTGGTMESESRDFEDWDKKIYVNAISSANGIQGTSVKVNNNSGIISGNAQLTGGTAENVVVGFGSVLATGTYAHTSANGIQGTSVEINNNSGVISGNAQLTGGDSQIFSAIDEIKAFVISSSTLTRAYHSANGIHTDNIYAYNIKVENKGIISGNAQLTSGTAITPDAANISKEFHTLIELTAISNSILSDSANGIYSTSVEINNNSGIISGNAQLTGGTAEIGVPENTSSINKASAAKIEASANGIHSSFVTINNNSGVISGHVLLAAGTEIINGETQTSYTESTNSGNGIFSNYGDDNISVTNTGLIKGYSYSTNGDENNQSSSENSGYAIYAGDREGGTINNYGILAAGYDTEGKGAVVGGKATVIDYGLNVFVDIGGNVVSAELGKDTEEGKTATATIDNNAYTIINAEINNLGKDSSINLSKLNDKNSNLILNGVGTTTGALTVNTTGTIKDSIVNGYNTALTVNGGNLTATNTIFNGGGYNGEVTVVDVTNGGKLALVDASIINGNTTVSGASELTLGNHIQLNGNISGDKTGTLNLGDGTTTWADNAGYGTGALDNGKDEYKISHDNVESGDLKIYQNISGFNQINVDGRVTTYETAKLSEIKEINIEDGAQLVVRVNPLKDGKYTGKTDEHALYNSGAIITATKEEYLPDEEYSYNPQLIFKVNGMQAGGIIEMGTTDISGLTNAQIDTWSILNTAEKTEQKNGNGKYDVIIKDSSFKEIFKPINPPEMVIPVDPDPGMIIPGKSSGCEGEGPWCPIYESIKNANQLNELDPTGNADDTEEHRREGLLSLLDQIYANNPYNQSAMLAFKNVTTLRNQIFETKMPQVNEWIAAAHVNYAQSQQTKDRDITLGNTSIADKYKTNLSNYSALITAEHGYKQDKSLGFALGMAHSKASMSHSSKLDGNSFYLGLYNKHKVDNFELMFGTGFSFGTYDGTRTISNQYQSVTNNGKVQTATFDFYGQAKYHYALNESTFLEPKVRLSDVIVRQSSVNEDVSALALNQDTKMYHVPAVAIGVDLAKRFDLENSTLKTKVGILGERTFGHWDNLVDARIQNSTDFVTQGAQFQRSSVNLTLSAEHDLTQKLYYKATVNYGIAQREKDNLGVGLTVGYTF